MCAILMPLKYNYQLNPTIVTFMQPKSWTGLWHCIHFFNIRVSLALKTNETECLVFLNSYTIKNKNSYIPILLARYKISCYLTCFKVTHEAKRFFSSPLISVSLVIDEKFRQTVDNGRRIRLLGLLMRVFSILSPGRSFFLIKGEVPKKLMSPKEEGKVNSFKKMKVPGDTFPSAQN